MSAKGYFGFTETKPFRDQVCVLDGVEIFVRGQMDKTPSQGANILQMADKSTVTQIDFRDSDLPEILEFFSFKVPQRAVTEEAWWKLKKVKAYGRPVVLIDFDYEQVVFTAGPELTTFRLPRATAASLWAGFPITYPIVADINGTPQTVLDTGSPSTNEIVVSGNGVLTPGLTTGQKLSVRYVPGYYVSIVSMPQSNRGSNDLTREIELVESRSFYVAPPE